MRIHSRIHERCPYATPSNFTVEGKLGSSRRAVAECYRVRLWSLLVFLAPVTLCHAADLDWTEFIVPTLDCGVHSITLGPDGNMWFTEMWADKVGYITQQGKITEFPVTRYSRPQGITTGPDGNLWFHEINRGAIGRITPQGQVTEFKLPGNPTIGAVPAYPPGICAGPDGNVWFGIYGLRQKIGRISPGGAIQYFDLPDYLYDPSDLKAGPDGNVWFTSANGLHHITPSGKVSYYPALELFPMHMTWEASDRNLWFVTKTGEIGRMALNGETDLVGVVGNGARNTYIGMVVGPDGAFWIAQWGSTVPDGPLLWRAGIVGDTTKYPLRETFGIAADNSGHLWYTSYVESTIVRITIPKLRIPRDVPRFYKLPKWRVHPLWSAAVESTFEFGPDAGGALPLYGDWNGDGVDTPGVFQPGVGTFSLRNSNSGGDADVSFECAEEAADALPIAGDWNGDGIDTVGYYVPATGTFVLKAYNGSRTLGDDLTFHLGPAGGSPGWRPVAGDWDGDGKTTVGLCNTFTGEVSLTNANTENSTSVTFEMPAVTDGIPVAGDWDGDGIATLGYYEPSSGTWLLRDVNSSDSSKDQTYQLEPGGLPSVGGSLD